jgi:hypothetical protein
MAGSIKEPMAVTSATPGEMAPKNMQEMTMTMASPPDAAGQGVGEPDDPLDIGFGLAGQQEERDERGKVDPDGHLLK